MIVGIWGEDKTCKTSLALTFPKPMVIMEMDIGGYDRAKYRFQDDINKGLIKYEPYPMPLTFGTLNMEGLLDPSKLEIKPSKQVIGMKELFYKWAASYLRHLKDINIASIVIDTATLLYSITCDSYLQELQEKQLPLNANGLGRDGKQLRSQLLQIEYREPNNRMRGIIYNAKASGKHLIMTHHARDEYKPMPQRDGSIANSQTGKRERAGFSTLGDSADVIVHTFWDGVKNIPTCTVDLAEVKPLEGMLLETPTYEKIASRIKFFKGI